MTKAAGFLWSLITEPGVHWGPTKLGWVLQLGPLGSNQTGLGFTAESTGVQPNWAGFYSWVHWGPTKQGWVLQLGPLGSNQTGLGVTAGSTGVQPNRAGFYS